MDVWIAGQNFETGHQRTKQSLIPIGPVVSEMKILNFIPLFYF
jgi:hypothetical protein